MPWSGLAGRWCIPVAGTTRDVVTVRTALDGWPVELSDTAGLWAGSDSLERAGVELARERLARADLVLLVFDGSLGWSEADAALLASWPDALVVHNKSDLASSSGGGRPAGLGVSALMRQGLAPLVEQIVERLVPEQPPAGAAVPFTEDQVAELRRIGGDNSLGSLTPRAPRSGRLPRAGEGRGFK